MLLSILEFETSWIIKRAAASLAFNSPRRLKTYVSLYHQCIQRVICTLFAIMRFLLKRSEHLTIKFFFFFLFHFLLSRPLVGPRQLFGWRTSASVEQSESFQVKLKTPLSRRRLSSLPCGKEDLKKVYLNFARCTQPPLLLIAVDYKRTWQFVNNCFKFSLIFASLFPFRLRKLSM